MDKYNTPVFTSLVEISRLANTLQSVMDMGMEDITILTSLLRNAASQDRVQNSL